MDFLIVSLVLGLPLFMMLAYVIYSYRWLWANGYITVVLGDQHRDIYTKLIRLENGAAAFDSGDHRYDIDDGMIFTEGRFKRRKLYYRVGDRRPRNPFAEGAGEISDVSSIEYKRLAHNRVTEQLLSAFQTKLLTPTQSFMIVGIVVVVAVVILGWFLNAKITTLSDELTTGGRSGVVVTPTNQIPGRFQ